MRYNLKLSTPTALWFVNRSLSIGACACALFTYLTYATLPVRLHEAMLGGAVLTLVHLTAHIVLARPTDLEVSTYRKLIIICGRRNKS